ncbi:hypothetical protein F5X99DRAFT_414549 [Biscogniauxia marginata]|nr:hypothetical protein F5X99DRAFT_414549 [Biscogniauxia marginata]
MADSDTISTGADPPIKAAELIAIAAVSMALVTLFTAARMYARWILRRQCEWDDWAMVVAWIATIPLCALQIVMVQHGAGCNISDVSPEDLAEFSKAFLISQAVARVAIFFAKLSTLLLHARVFYPLRAALWATRAVIALNLLYAVALVLAVALRWCCGCGLPGLDVDQDQWGVLLASSAVNVVSDVTTLVVPLASVWGLQMADRRAVRALFAAGSFPPLASGARLAYQAVVAAGGDDTAGNVTVAYAAVMAFAAAEQVVAVAVGCAPFFCAWVVRRARAGHNRSAVSRLFGPVVRRGTAAGGESKAAFPDPFPIPACTASDIGDEEESYSAVGCGAGSSTRSTGSRGSSDFEGTACLRPLEPVFYVR